MTTSDKNKLATLNLNGNYINAKPGQTIIQAAMDHGIYIPYLCYHPGLDPYGACRMCVVETEVNGRKSIQASCTTPVSDGMIVNSTQNDIKDLRQGIMDLLITEHPHGCLTCHRIELCGPQDVCQRHVSVTDRCTTCPKNERCELKDTIRSTELDMKTPLNYNRRNLPIHTDDPFYDRDYNLCIVCVRCVRVCDEVRVDNALALKQRSGIALVGTASGKSLIESGCEFCGACIDMCPTGALVEREYKWEKMEKKTKTICSNCPVGCQLISETNKFNKVIRLIGDLAGATNQGQTCMRGKFAYDYVNDKSLNNVYNKKKQKITYEEGLNYLSTLITNTDSNNIGIYNSPRSTNEDLFLSKLLFKKSLKINNFDLISNSTQNIFNYLYKSNGAAASKGQLSNISTSDNVVISLGNPSEMQNIVAMKAKQASRAGKNLIIIDPRETEMTRYASEWIRMHPENVYKLLKSISKIIVDKAEESPVTINFPNLDIAISDLSSYDIVKIAKEINVNEKQIRQIASLLVKGNTSFIFGTDLMKDSIEEELYLSSLFNLMHFTGNSTNDNSAIIPLYNGANQAGALHVGANKYFENISDFESQVKVNSNPELSIIFEDGISKEDITNHPEIRNSKFKVLFTNKINFIKTDDLNYDLIIPTTNFSTRSGTYINIENRIQYTGSSVEAKGDTKEIWRILSDLAQLLNFNELVFPTYNSLFDRMSKEIQSFNMLDINEIKKESKLLNIKNSISFINLEYPQVKTVSSVRLYEGRVLLKNNFNETEEKVILEISADVMKNNGIEEGALVTLIGESDNSIIMGEAKTLNNMNNTVSVTNLFGEMAKEMQDSNQKDWSMNIPKLDSLVIKQIKR